MPDFIYVRKCNNTDTHVCCVILLCPVRRRETYLCIIYISFASKTLHVVTLITVSFRLSFPKKLRASRNFAFQAMQAWKDKVKNTSTHPDSMVAWLLLLPTALLTELLLAELEFASSCIWAVLSNELHCLITSSPWASSSEIIVASSRSCNAVLEFNLKDNDN